ncbi:cytochrome ubiquinol oxidase subunit I [Bacillus marinisedimentorum]|uniref:cytochrome ubiquinol oxidase subunit I n=1 Tax=Bacillus marinisedimentorum TaxID=1821260 RepID=UPI0008729BD9|nr:cytochrome ubiquinol oxidase subunit I [Bacillus marinisedimentorum]
MSEVLILSRIQFAVTVFYHFLFVPLTIGLVILLAVMETKFARTRDPLYRRMADFWGKLFVINFVLGIVTGITMEFQFGTNWSEYSKYMGDIFGSPLAIEALVAFFLESTFIGIYIFGKDKISPKMRAFSIWMVAIGTNISAIWIITANGFMQNPVGYVLNNGRAELASFTELVSNPYAWYMFFHTIFASYIVGSFFVMAISAYHLLRKNEVEFFKRSFRMALVMAVIAATVTPIIGHQHGVFTATKQPAKAAAMEAVWDTGQGLPFSLIQIPDAENEKNFEALSIPNLGSFFYTNSFNGEVTGLKEIPADERPNVPLVFYSFRAMGALGIFFLAMAWYGVYLYRKNKLVDSRKYLKTMLYSILLPYLAINLGWMVAEAGRQPWAVYGLMKTAEAVSPISVGQVIFSLAGLVIFYTILIIADVYLITKFARKGPELPAKTGLKGDVEHVS